MQHFQAAIFAVDTGEIWYKVCKDTNKARLKLCLACEIKVECMIDIESSLLFSIKHSRMK
jgi:hypothetical protein